MTASQIPFQPGAFTAPVIDYEPAPNVAGRAAPELNVAGRAAPELNVAGRAAPCPQSPAALHQAPRRPLRPVNRTSAEASPPRAACEVAPPPAAATFADAVLRRVLEVIDRRRPIAHLRPVLTPTLLDMVLALTRTGGTEKAAVLRRVRLRTAAVDDQETIAAEVFATYTRGLRVRAIAARVEFERRDQCGGRWRVVALHIG